MSVWITILLAIVFVVLATNIVLYFIQDKIIFQSEELPKDFKFTFQRNFEEINLESEDGNTLNGILFKEKQPKGLIVYFHNHSGNLKYCGTLVAVFSKHNFDVLMMDYRGYGKSTGKFNEKLLLNDAQLWYNYAKANYKEERIYLYGRGIGATFAAYLASVNQPNRLFLESPMYSLPATARSQYPYWPIEIALKYRFDTAKYIQKVTCKSYIFHGKKDNLNTFANCKKLFKLANDKTELIAIEEGTHFNIRNTQEYQHSITEILNA